MKELFGKMVRSLHIDEEKTYLLFTLETVWSSKTELTAYLIYKVTGDCCAQSWIEDINGYENLLHAEIVGVEKKEYRDNVKNVDNHDDHLDIYGWTLKTQKGHIDFEFRASHNGYYGGDFELVQDAKIMVNDAMLLDAMRNPYLKEVLEGVVWLQYDGSRIPLRPYGSKISLPKDEWIPTSSPKWKFTEDNPVATPVAVEGSQRCRLDICPKEELHPAAWHSPKGTLWQDMEGNVTYRQMSADRINPDWQEVKIEVVKKSKE